MNKNFFLYSILAIPLSFIGIPIYVYIANFYANLFALSISLIVLTILASRVVDVFQDPLIGAVSDNLIKKGVGREKIIIFNVPLLAVSFYFLFKSFDNHTIAIIRANTPWFSDCFSLKGTNLMKYILTFI